MSIPSQPHVKVGFSRFRTVATGEFALIQSVCKMPRRIVIGSRATRGVDLSKLSRTSLGAFSLVEVTIAIGLVSFSMLAVLGLLPVGLNICQESIAQTAEAGISQQIRAELLQIPFSGGNGYSILDLPSQTYYFTQRGTKTEETSDDAYYVGTFEVNDPVVPGMDTNTVTSQIQTIKVTLSYPKGVPASSQKFSKFSLLAAKQ